MTSQSTLIYPTEVKRIQLDDSTTQNRRHRCSFQELWKKDFEWVEYDNEKDDCHCTLCIEAVAEGMH